MNWGLIKHLLYDDEVQLIDVSPRPDWRDQLIDQQSREIRILREQRESLTVDLRNTRYELEEML